MVFVYIRYIFSSHTLFFLLTRLPPISTSTYTLVPYTTLFRAGCHGSVCAGGRGWRGFGPAGIRARAPATGAQRVGRDLVPGYRGRVGARGSGPAATSRSEEHTYELQSLMRISYAVFFLKKKKRTTQKTAAQGYASTNGTQ